MNNIKIDPCSACLNYYDITDINNINSCCYNTLGAFLNKNNINDIKNSPEAKNCFNCVQQSIRALGRDPCEFRLSPPPIISTSPHFLPYILKDETNLNIAYNKCLDMCQTSKECIRNCNIDALAVKYGQQSTTNPQTPTQKPEMPSVNPILTPTPPEMPSVNPILTSAPPEMPSINPILTPAPPEMPSVNPILTPVPPVMPSVNPILTPVPPVMPSINPILTPAPPAISSQIKESFENNMRDTDYTLLYLVIAGFSIIFIFFILGAINQ